MILADSNRPVPSAIDGRRWTVRGAPGMVGATHTRGAEMYVPLADTDTARFVRNHELMHAKITPRIDAGKAAAAAGVSFEALQWSEDWRVCARLDSAGLIPDGAVEDWEADTVAKNVGRSRRMAAGAMLGLHDAYYPRMRVMAALERVGWTAGELQEIDATIVAMVSGALAGASARRGRRGRKPKPTIGTHKGFQKITIPLARLFDSAFPPNGSGGDANGKPSPAPVDRVPGLARWAPVSDIRRLTMDRAVKPRRPIGRRFSDCGVIPSAVHRLPVDGAIFGTKRRAKGGSILCDASGSMHYSDDDIERILREAPAATIAFYSGSNGSRKQHGRIIIAADRGRAATVEAVHEALPGSENLIDGPALRWLAKQPAPRFWVSDEEVGGIDGFGRGSAAHAECLAICRAAGIKIVRRLAALK